MRERAVVSRHQDLATFRLARNLAFQVHTMRLCRPQVETGDVAYAVRRVARLAMQAIAAVGERPLTRTQVVHGLLAAQNACDEARVHLDLLRRTGGLADGEFRALHDGYQRLGHSLAHLVAEARLSGQAALWLSLRVGDDYRAEPAAAPVYHASPPALP